MRGRFLALAVGLALACGTARASGPIGANGAPITTSAYNVDLFQGPVLASCRITGLGGSYVALADSSDGNPFNPASVALRLPYSILPTDFDLTASYTLPSSIKGTDFYNSGSKDFTTDDFVFLTGGANIQNGHFGLGATLNLQVYNLNGVSLPSFPKLQVSVVTGHILGAYAFANDQLLVGLGARIVSFSADGTGNGSSTTLLSMAGAGLETGILWAPRPLPLRVGVVGRTPVQGNPQPGSQIQPNAQGDTLVGPLFIPQNLVLPWELEAGVAFQFGPRPLNIPWTDRRKITDEEIATERGASPPPAPGEKPEPRRTVAARILNRRYEAIPRSKLLVTTSLLVTGAVSDAVGFESFLGQKVDRSGQSVSLTPRLGVEGEPIANWLQLRAGTYYEPTRFERSSARLHGTFGFDLKLFSWSVFGLFNDWTTWRAGAVIDGARDYFAWSISVGIWH